MGVFGTTHGDFKSCCYRNESGEELRRERLGGILFILMLVGDGCDMAVWSVSGTYCHGGSDYGKNPQDQHRNLLD